MVARGQKKGRIDKTILQRVGFNLAGLGLETNGKERDIRRKKRGIRGICEGP
jgi:hypothetical protein